MAMAVRQDLELNMAGMLYKVLDVHGIVAERHLRLFLGCLEAALKLLRRLRHAHAFPAASKSRLHDHRVADLLRDLRSLFCVVHRLFAARDHRYSGSHHGVSRLLLVSQPGNDVRSGADKGDVALLAQLRKPAVLREKTKSRMDGIGAGNDGGADDPVHAQIALCGGRRANADGLVRKLCVEGLPVCLRVDGHGLNPHLPAGPDNADRDLAPVGDQYFFDHLTHFSFILPSVYPTIKVSSALTTTLPSTLAVASPIPIGPLALMIFVSSFTLSPGTIFPLNLHLLMPPK